MRRRRRTKYNWLPTVGGIEAQEGSPFTTVQTISLAVVPLGITTGLVPVVQNHVPGAFNEANQTLVDLIGNEYILKRIVGKVFAAVTATTSDDTSPTPLDSIPSIVVSAGFLVARLDPDSSGNAVPVGGIAIAAEAYNPLNNALQREPWIWRRTWVLGIGTGPPMYVPNATVPTRLERATIETTGDPLAATIAPIWPSSNTAYPGVLDGPHVDAKTGRRVRQDEGLFFACAAHYLPYGTLGPPAMAITADLLLDVRCLGAIRRAKNRSNF